jgi:hypothetical protein
VAEAVVLQVMMVAISILVGQVVEVDQVIILQAL